MSDYALRSFMPNGETVAITAAASSPAGVQCRPGGQAQFGSEPGAAGGGPVQYRIYNSHSALVYLGYSQVDAATAQTMADDTPASGNAGAAIPIPAGAIEVWTLPRNAYFTFQTDTTSGTVWMTPGKGV